MKIIYPEDHNGSEMYFVNLYSGTFLLKRIFFFFLAQEILNSFYGTIRIYCFNRAEMKFGTCIYSSNVFQTKNEKKEKKAVEVEEGKEMEEGGRGRKPTQLRCWGTGKTQLL